MQQSYFEVLGVEESFDVDLRKLEESYLRQQAMFHPDRHVNAEPERQAEYLQKSTLVNTAYKVIKNPLKRAEHLLGLKGVEAPANGSSPAVLAEMMELGEEAESKTGIDEAARFRSELSEFRLAALSDFGRNFSAGNLAGAAQNLLRARFLERMLDNMNARLHAHEG